MISQEAWKYRSSKMDRPRGTTKLQKLECNLDVTSMFNELFDFYVQILLQLGTLFTEISYICVRAYGSAQLAKSFAIIFFRANRDFLN